MAAFDITTAVAEFVADTARSSLTLPHMTSGQRKSAKKLLGQHPEVQCESYGFGAERQLHIFKKGAEEPQQEETFPATELVNIKNTFIDDWVAPASPSRRREIQSMPHGMFSKCIFEEEGAKGTDTPSTTGSETPVEVSEPEASEPEASEPSIVNARWADVEHDAATGEKRTRPLYPGELVVVEGLVKNPAFNGCSAVVQGLDEATGRYNILLASAQGVQPAKIKVENLRLVLACP